MVTRILISLVLLVSVVARVSAQGTLERIPGTLMVLSDGTFGFETEQYGKLRLKLDASKGDLRQLWKKFKTGDALVLEGIVQDGELLMPSANPIDRRMRAPDVLPHLLPNTTGTQSVLFILADYSNTSPPYLMAFGHGRLSNEVTAAAEAFSYGQLSFDVTTTPWLSIALTNASCNFLQLADQADAAAATFGFAVGNYQRIVYGFSFTGACGWSGLSTIGGTPSRAWLNGVFAVKTAVHELGHSLGLHHSHSADCRPAVVGVSCLIDEYGDWLDTMGLGPFDPATGTSAYPHVNAVQKEHLGWASGAGPLITEVTSSGVYFVWPMAVDDGEPKALKLPYAAQPGMSLYVETRQPFGTDAFLMNYPDIIAGVVLHLGTPDDPTTSYLLDAHPETATWQDAALRVGDVFAEAGAGFQLHVIEVTTDGATVAVDAESDTINLALLSPWQPVWRNGQTLRIDVQVTVGTQPAEGGLWEWAVEVPTVGYFVEPSTTLGPDGMWTLEVPITNALPRGLYTLWGRASWFSKVTPIVSGQLILQ